MPADKVQGTLAERMATVEGWIDNMDHVLNGNGQPGLIQDIRNFLAEAKTEKATRLQMETQSATHRTEMQQAHDRKMTLRIGIVSVVIAGAALLAPFLHEWIRGH